MRYWDLTYTSLNFSFYHFSCFRLSYDCLYILGPSCFSEALLIIIGFLGGYSSFILIFCGVVSCFADANGLFLLFDIVLVICSGESFGYQNTNYRKACISKACRKIRHYSIWWSRVSSRERRTLWRWRYYNSFGIHFLYFLFRNS